MFILLWKSYLALSQIDHIRQMITISVITLRGLHCTYYKQMLHYHHVFFTVLQHSSPPDRCGLHHLLRDLLRLLRRHQGEPLHDHHLLGAPCLHLPTRTWSRHRCLHAAVWCKLKLQLILNVYVDKLLSILCLSPSWCSSPSPSCSNSEPALQPTCCSLL